jgi:hypothetical protein
MFSRFLLHSVKQPDQLSRVLSNRILLSSSHETTAEVSSEGWLSMLSGNLVVLVSFASVTLLWQKV